MRRELEGVREYARECAPDDARECARESLAVSSEVPLPPHPPTFHASKTVSGRKLWAEARARSAKR